MIYHVKSDWIELYSKPYNERKFWKTSLPLGHELRLINGTGQWWYIGTYFQCTYIEGFVHPQGLRKGACKKLNPPTPRIAEMLPESCSEYVSKSSLQRNLPIGDAETPRFESQSTSSRINGIFQTLDYLDVENNPRYKAQGNNTFCHIYVQDFAQILNLHMPRIGKVTIASDYSKEEGKNQFSEPESECIVGARLIYDWLFKWGKKYGWTQVFSPQKAQSYANRGYLCVLSARRKMDTEAGHISLIIPESDTDRAIRQDGQVTIPLMSHAGRRNLKTFTKAWWIDKEFHFFGFWVAESIALKNQP